MHYVAYHRRTLKWHFSIFVLIYFLAATTIYSLFSFLFLVNSCLNAFIDMSFSNCLVFPSHRIYRLGYRYFFTQLIFQYCPPSSVHFLEVAWFAAISLAANK